MVRYLNEGSLLEAAREQRLGLDASSLKCDGCHKIYPVSFTGICDMCTHDLLTQLANEGDAEDPQDKLVYQQIQQQTETP